MCKSKVKIILPFVLLTTQNPPTWYLTKVFKVAFGYKEKNYKKWLDVVFEILETFWEKMCQNREHFSRNWLDVVFEIF